MKTRRWMKTLPALCFTAVMLFPVYWMINVSFTKPGDLRKSTPNLFPVDPTLEGYDAVLSDQLPSLGTSLVIGLGTVVLTLVIAAPAGFALAKLHFVGRGALNFTLLAVQMIPAVVMAMGFYAIYLRMGMLNSIPGVIVADSTIAVPFGVLLLTAFMSGLPTELLQAAKMDGAGTWRTFRSIVLPISRNSLVTVSLFSFLWAWSDFIFASTLARGAEYVPVTLGIYKYMGNNTSQWNAIMATAVIASIPAAILLIVAQRYVSAGVTAGAVKD
ncbi:carbohydrate ABC transporter permease [Streptomyces sp. AHA2]|uniref:carbohydrate ABC transporter permease n=1 Tax=Streptomyces sp. AHA2 TaxID=3064526 RepID=UPI002FE1EBC9